MSLVFLTHIGSILYILESPEPAPVISPKNTFLGIPFPRLL